MLLHFKKSNEILETWSPHCKNLAFKDPPSFNFHNRTDANLYESLINHYNLKFKSCMDSNKYALLHTKAATANFCEGNEFKDA